MRMRSKVPSAVLAGAVSTALVLSIVPAEAGGFGRGFLPGLIGGLALGALAASAQADQQGAPLYAAVPDAPADFGFDEISPVDAPTRVRPRQPSVSRRVVAPARATPPRAVATSAVLAPCREAIAATSRRHGATDVRVARAGAEQRGANGGLTAPLTARIVYAQRGQRQVKQAQVTCQLDANGRVIAFR